MKKHEIRKEFFKLKFEGHSYAVCRRLLKSLYDYEVDVRTLKRWVKRLDEGTWNLLDNSRRPHTIHYKITPAIEQEVIGLRKKTGWGEDKLHPHLRHLNISKMSIKRILRRNNLCRETKNKGKRKKWVRWQREHPNSLWQIDHTETLR